MRYLLVVIFLLFALTSITAKAEDSAQWAGDLVVKITRGDSSPCAGANAYFIPVNYDDWAATRAEVTNICFDVWVPGITDTDNQQRYKEVVAKMVYRHTLNGDFDTIDVADFFNQAETAFGLVGRHNNNLQYAANLRALSPFSYSPKCLSTPVELEIKEGKSGYFKVAAEMELYFLINGKKLTHEDWNLKVIYSTSLTKETLDFYVNNCNYQIRDSNHFFVP